MESEVYREHFQYLRHNWTDYYDFILTCTYRHTVATDQKVLPLTFEYLKSILTVASQQQVDVFPLEPYPHMDILSTLMASHGLHSIRAWNVLLMGLGYDHHAIGTSSHIFSFWRSSYLVRREFMFNLTDHILQAMSVVDNNGNVTVAFRRDARYQGGDPIVAFQVFGTPYYHMHPFIFERLPSFFLYQMGARKVVRPIALENITAMVHDRSLYNVTIL